MSRNADYQFISTDTDALVSKLIASYEAMTGTTVQPASPEKLLIVWVANVIIQERVQNNYTGNQNLPSRAEGENLDPLGEQIYNVARPSAQAAICTERFYLSAAQATKVLIPAGTRVTDSEKTLIWETTADVYVESGALSADAMLQCQTLGAVGNGYAAGQIGVLVDLFPYYDHCENTTQSDKGADEATDDEYYDLMRASQDAYSTAGAKGGYIYFAKQVSTEIADVVANSPRAGWVSLYVLMRDGSLAGTEIKNAVLSACNPDSVRAFTDDLSVNDAEAVDYDITLTYYIPSNAAKSSAEVQDAVQAAVNDYVAWQCAKFGRDINPDELRQRVKASGVKRVELTSPAFTPLRDGSDNTVPQVAHAGMVTFTNGGFEDE